MGPYRTIDRDNTEAGVPRSAAALILGVSAAALAFLIWLIYVKPASGAASDAVTYLPALNATLNALCAVCLTAGFIAIRNGRIQVHAACMLSAVAFSALFLVSYIIYHNVHGDTPFTGQGWVRPAYFFILISHIAATFFALPLILTVLFLAFTRRFLRHKRFARVTLPLWLYVSVTGVAIYFLLRAHS